MAETREELEALKVDDLKAKASDAGLEGYSSMRKAELVDLLADDGATTTTEDRPVSEPETRTTTRTTTIGEEEVERTATDHVLGQTDGIVPDLEGAGPAVEPGGIDPSIVERRDATRERQDVPRGRARPQPASIDPRLVEKREALRERQAEQADRPATEPPARG